MNKTLEQLFEELEVSEIKRELAMVDFLATLNLLHIIKAELKEYPVINPCLDGRPGRNWKDSRYQY